MRFLNWLCYKILVTMFYSTSLHNMKIIMMLLSSAFLVCQVIGEEKLEFNRDIRPILSDACFHCHGPDEKERKGGLRLDLQSHAFKAGKSGFEAIIRGNAKDSEIITRIHLPEDDSEHMPPTESGKSLTEEQKKILVKWIDQGAEYQGHWAFIAPERPVVPKIKGADHPIDAFLQNRLPFRQTIPPLFFHPLHSVGDYG